LLCSWSKPSPGAFPAPRRQLFARPLSGAAASLTKASSGIVQPPLSERFMSSPSQAPAPPDTGEWIARLLQRLGPRRQEILFATGAVILLFNVAILAWTSEQSQSQAQWANHSLEVQNKLSDVLLLLRTAESEQRAYILVRGKTASRTSYFEAAAEIPVKLAEVRSMTSDNPSQLEKVRELDPLIQEKLDDLALKMRLLEAGDTAAAIDLFQQGKGRELMTAIKARVTQLCAAEQRLLATRSDKSTRASRQLLFVGMADSLVIFLLGWLTISFSFRSIQSLEAVKAALEAKVEERVAELREAYDEMQSFAYIVGHDLRAPLVNIMGFTSEIETLWNSSFKQQLSAQSPRGEGFNEQTALAEFDEAIGFIKAAALKMERLISAVLGISRTGKRELKPERIDMTALVKSVMTTLAHEAQAVDAEIEVGPLPPIHCDRLALEQVFTNLLDNALKYLRPGTAGRIHIIGYTTAQRVIYEVRDNGRGIAEADQKRVFELFRRCGVQDQRGDGIGLAHVRALVRCLGGTIKLTSTLHAGSTFKVMLPCNCADR
jgi:signal transduction histidine kinase